MASFLRRVASRVPREALTGLLRGRVVVRGYAEDANLKKTVLHDYHVAQGAKMVPFAGWSMPIQYKDSIIDSTKWCREKASIFDVSHMCGISLRGKGAIAFVERLVVGDIAGLSDGTGTLSVMTNEDGGIIDDCIVTKVDGSHLYVVLNAGCRDKDLTHIGQHLAAAKAKGEDVNLHVYDERSLLAFQGPEAAAVLQPLLKGVDLARMSFSDFAPMDVAGAACFVTRTGYTGEDGFEISVPSEKTVFLTERLMADPRVRMCGLGARDALRLEAGLCLYGNDLDETISPLEAGLTWTIGKRRRTACDFVGGKAIMKQLESGVARKRIGLLSAGAPARGHSDILGPDGTKVGEVTSGAFSPCLTKNVAMGYVSSEFAKLGLERAGVSMSSKQHHTKAPLPPTRIHRGGLPVKK